MLREMTMAAHSPDANADIRSEDSVSSVGSRDGSRLSTRSRASSKSSIRSSARAKCQRSREKSDLYGIQEEELRLQQTKRQLELQTSIAKANAEERVYAAAQAEAMNNLYTVDDAEDVSQQEVNLPSPSLPNPLIHVTRRDANVLSNAAQDIIQYAATQQQPPPTSQNEMPRENQQLNSRAAHWNYDAYNTVSQENMHETILDRIIDSQDRQSSAFHYLLNQQQENVMALTLPQPDLPVFNGDPTNYCDFIRAFENLIERKTNSWSSRLYYLVQYTSGQVQELMRSCLSMREEEGYREARRLLLERYGQAYKIASAFVERISNGPPIKAEDGLGLQRFSILLTSCSNTLKEIGYLSKLENPDGMRKIIDRLPFSRKAKWREVVDGIMQRDQNVETQP